jgi:hypothetical protein
MFREKQAWDIINSIHSDVEELKVVDVTGGAMM